MASKSIPQRLSLVHSVSRETVNTLEQLLEGARAGEVVGLAFCAVLKGPRYIVDLTGEARRNPTFARGMVCALDDELQSRVHERAMAAPTLNGFD